MLLTALLTSLLMWDTAIPASVDSVETFSMSPLAISAATAVSGASLGVRLTAALRTISSAAMRFSLCVGTGVGVAAVGVRWTGDDGGG